MLFNHPSSQMLLFSVCIIHLEKIFLVAYLALFSLSLFLTNRNGRTLHTWLSCLPLHRIPNENPTTKCVGEFCPADYPGLVVAIPKCSFPRKTCGTWSGIHLLGTFSASINYSRRAKKAAGFLFRREIVPIDVFLVSAIRLL